jgi:RimJ/RimL family protein N-acetyltransferase
LKRATAPRIFEGLETPRLVIRRFCRADLEPFLAYRNDPEVARYQAWQIPYRRDEAETFVWQQSRSHPGISGKWFQFAIELKGSDELIGDCALRYTKIDRCGEIGYTVARAHQGKGLASEAVACVIDYAIRELRTHRVVAITECRNRRSIAMLRRLGFRREGRLLRSSVHRARHAWQDEYLYAILAGEWIERKKRRLSGRPR